MQFSELQFVKYYGQKDLSEITKTSIQQLSLIDEFIKDKLTLLKSKEKTIKNKLSELIKEIHKLEKTEEKVEEQSIIRLAPFAVSAFKTCPTFLGARYSPFSFFY